MLDIKTEKELLDKLAALGDMDDETRNDVVCALIGHSKIQSAFFGYYSCSRCGEQLGDIFGGFYPEAASIVIVGHDCPACRANYEKLDWRHRIFVPYPFPEEDTATDQGTEGRDG